MKKDLTVYPYFGKKNTVAEAIWQRFSKTGGEYFVSVPATAYSAGCDFSR
jgi:hypothetical protein